MFHLLDVPKYIVSAFLLPSLVLFGLWGCGQKGDLYLPTIPESPDVIKKESILEGESSADQSDPDDLKKDKKLTGSSKVLP